MCPPLACVNNQASADAIYALFNGAGYDVYQIDDEAVKERSVGSSWTTALPM
jgi:hypothetical protein